MTPSTSCSWAGTLPNEILALISRNCSRFTLINCCLVNKTLYAISAPYLYHDPFTLHLVDLGYPDCAIPLWQRLESYRIRELCRTVAENSHLAHLVRAFRTVFWTDHVLSQADTMLVLAHLTNIVTVDLDAGSFRLSTSPPFDTAVFLDLIRDHCPGVQHMRVDITATSRSYQSDFTVRTVPPSPVDC